MVISTKNVGTLLRNFKEFHDNEMTQYSHMKRLIQMKGNRGDLIDYIEHGNVGALIEEDDGRWRAIVQENY
jgi:hypothetical protein